MSKTTSLHPIHTALAARMVPFAGWDMPVSYPIGTAAEVKACRSGAGVFDVSHMGEVIVDGGESLAFLQHITTNDVARLSPGDAQYSMLLNEHGGVIDDIIVYRISSNQFTVVINAGCHDKDYSWIAEQSAKFKVEVTDISDLTALIAVQGPHAVGIAATLTDSPVKSLKRFQFLRDEKFDGIHYSRTGYTGEDGFELFCSWEAAPALWNAVVERGAVPCGLGARDVLRLEAAYPLYGYELSEINTPYESGTGWAVKLKKGQFIGAKALLKQKEEGVTESLVGIRMVDPPNAIARDGFPILNVEGEGPVGVITSGTLSPTVGGGIALARVRTEHAEIGERLLVEIRGRRVPAQVEKLPFYRNGV